MGRIVKENNTFNFENLSENFKRFYERVRAGKSCSVFGVINSLRPAIVSNFNKKVLYLTADSILAKTAVSDFKSMGLNYLSFDTSADEFLFKKAQSNEISLQKTQTLFNILEGNFDGIVAPITSLFSFLPDVNKFQNSIISLKIGQNIQIKELELKLVSAGYHKEDIIFDVGQFSRHGEVLDIFTVNGENPFRIDFFDTEIESIKVLDIESQKGTKAVNEIKICPCSDLLLSEDEKNNLTKKLVSFKKSNSDEIAIKKNTLIDELLVRLSLGEQGYNLSLLLPLLDEKQSSIFDYLKATNLEFVTVIDECKQVFDSMQNFANEQSLRIKNLKDDGLIFAEKLPYVFSTQQVVQNFKNNTNVAFLKITNNNNFFISDEVFNFKSSAVPKFTHNISELGLEVKTRHKSGVKVFLFAGSSEQATSLNGLLSAKGLNLDTYNSLSLSDSKSKITEKFYNSGFYLPEEKVMVIGTYDIFTKKRERQKLSTGRENAFSIPRVGDYVVHHFHGIGICEGVTTLTGSFGTKDYVVIRYRDDDKLYVPTTQMDMLDRFSGAETPKKLSKIGGQDFAAVKNKVKESVKKLAFNLVELYAKRDKIKGFAYSEDTDLQREFENSFPFTETEDQLISTEEIKKDMQQPKVMDRLLCGDVGFGKTEVALRAAFKAIMDGKQVAFVAPTTILSEQHYNTACSRMLQFGVNIAVLNRFKTKSETEKVLNDLSSGKIDMVCGTHRVLSKDVEFKNLGLIILDEEQKFGVEDKEKLKLKYPKVDVLTLSATPIPRTLSMSLSGIRDISIISTPPSERLPIQTFVTEYNEGLIKDAISRELSRGGQVFVLYNSVEHIYSFAEKLKAIVPDAKIIVAHGQMPARELENKVFDFYNKRADVLVCTTIIENGIDVENANTLIVIDSDKLGLSQLYQIRGRVGRSNRMAYAYLTYNKNKILTEEAYKRLDAISELCEFGSGFKLAMRDLEIRGGGNILGAEQSGHLQKIGYDMYAKLLSDAIKQLRGEAVEKENDVLVKVQLDAYVPDDYILTSEERMLAYKRISGIKTLESAEKLKLEIDSAYGRHPEVVENLIKISLARQLAAKVNAIEIYSSGNEIQLIFESAEQITKDSELAEAVFKFRNGCFLDLSNKPMIKFNKSDKLINNFDILIEFLIEFNNQKEKKS